ncbi:MAG: endonuclease III [Myxococcota bacterium]|jgi:endonuclease-3|nr:endonuclease III [Myxococcota bacterium]
MEAPEDLKKRVKKVLRLLDRDYGGADCALTHKNAFELLAATILSAQCTDKRVNMVTPKLFEAFPSPFLLAQGRQEEVEEIIRSTGFYRNKAKNLIGMAQKLVEVHAGEVPKTIEELTGLPGAARKTANVVLGVAFGIASGVVVDTHVTRISRLLGFTHETSPVKIERDLMKILPKPKWIGFSHQLILHGRAVCIARRPQCQVCALRKHCPGAEA